MQLSQKQSSIAQTINQKPEVDKVFLIGALATSKTYAMAHFLISLALTFESSYIPVARKSMPEIRIGTLLTFFEVLDAMGLMQDADYRYVGGSEIKFTFNNKSIIQFIQLDHTKDRDWHRIKSINATAVGVDEVDGVQFDGFTMLAARVGRKNSNGAPPVIVATCNPNETWVKEHIYLPWRNNALPSDTEVIEFKIEDSFLYNDGYYDKYGSNPEQWRQRYLFNNWDYLDDESSIFKSKVLDNIHVAEYDNTQTHYIGNDVAREGKDRNVFALIVGNVLVDIKILNKADLDRLATPNEKAAPPYSHIVGRELIKYCERYECGYENVAVDAVGNGGGVVDYCRSVSFNVNEFKAGARPFAIGGARDLSKPDYSSDYDMLRSQMYHQLALDMERGEFFLYDGCPFLAELKQELLFHLYEVKDKVMCIESKDKIKKRLGKSPDISDAVTMAYFNKKKMINKRHNVNRIAY